MTDHRCRRAERCAQTEKTDTGRVGGRIHTEDGLCLTCTRHVADAITQLPRDWVDLYLALPHGDSPARDLVLSSPELPTPVRISIAELRDRIVAEACTWVEPVAELLRIDWDVTALDRWGNLAGRRRRPRPGPTLQRACRIVAPNLSVLLALRDVDVLAWDDTGWYHQPEPVDGITGALDLLRCHHVTRAALGRTRLTHHLPAPCPSIDCGAMALVRHDGAEDVHCEHCHRRWSEQDYRRLTLILAADYRAA